MQVQQCTFAFSACCSQGVRAEPALRRRGKGGGTDVTSSKICSSSSVVAGIGVNTSFADISLVDARTGATAGGTSGDACWYLFSLRRALRSSERCKPGVRAGLVALELSNVKELRCCCSAADEDVGLT